MVREMKMERKVGGSGSFNKVGTFGRTRMIRGVEIMKRPLKSFLFFRYSASSKCLVVKNSSYSAP